MEKVMNRTLQDHRFVGCRTTVSFPGTRNSPWSPHNRFTTNTMTAMSIEACGASYSMRSSKHALINHGAFATDKSLPILERSALPSDMFGSGTLHCSWARGCRVDTSLSRDSRSEQPTSWAVTQLTIFCFFFEALASSRLVWYDAMQACTQSFGGRKV